MSKRRKCCRRNNWEGSERTGFDIEDSFQFTEDFEVYSGEEEGEEREGRGSRDRDRCNKHKKRRWEDSNGNGSRGGEREGSDEEGYNSRRRRDDSDDQCGCSREGSGRNRECRRCKKFFFGF